MSTIRRTTVRRIFGAFKFVITMTVNTMTRVQRVTDVRLLDKSLVVGVAMAVVVVVVVVVDDENFVVVVVVSA